MRDGRGLQSTKVTPVFGDPLTSPNSCQMPPPKAKRRAAAGFAAAGEPVAAPEGGSGAPGRKSPVPPVGPAPRSGGALPPKKKAAPKKLKGMMRGQPVEVWVRTALLNACV